MNKTSQDTYQENRISVIEINGMWFGVDILKSKEVLPLPTITPVPNTKKFVLGVFNLRGEIYSLIDIAGILGMNPKPVKNSDMIILLSTNKVTMGILVDRIHGVRPVNNASIKPAHGVVSKKMEEFISGVVSEKTSFIYILDLDRVFSSQVIRTFY